MSKVNSAPRRLVVLLSAVLLLSGCVSTAVGVVVGTTVAVGTAVVAVPIKAGGAVMGAAIGGNDKDED